MTWYLPFTSVEFFLCLFFVVLYGGYLFRIKRLALQFNQTANALWIKAILRTLYMGLLIVALMGPSFGAMTKEIRTNGKDVIVAVDLSQSMDAIDVPPSRLENVKRNLQDFFEQSNSDRIGIMGFTSEAFMVCPFTYDMSALQLFTQSLRSNLAPFTSAELNVALELARQKFRETETGRDTERSKILIIFSDGETFNENTRATARTLQADGIHVFCVGTGTHIGGKIPNGRSFKQDEDGETVITRLEPETLQEIADITGGAYFEINQSINELPRLISAVNNVKSELRQTKVIEVAANKYLYPLMLALFLIALDVLWTLQVLRI